MASSILIVEDERDLVATLEYALQREGFRTIAVHSGKQALAAIADDPGGVDLVLLDLMLPDMPGTQVCQQVRTSERTRRLPVIMMTAKAEEIDVVVGFEVGADDYVIKPFSVRELVLRVRAVLRRGAADPATASVALGPVRIDPSGHRTWVGEHEVALTALEFRLLSVFMARVGRVLSRDDLLREVWEMDGSLDTRTVDTHVLRLRKKLGAAGEQIETLRGVGYRFTAGPPA
jgi:two-component system phosphate regulon response regulator PhoB